MDASRISRYSHANDVLLSRLGLNGVEEELIAEEIQRTDEADTRVIASLKHRDQRCSFANSGRVLGKYTCSSPFPPSSQFSPYLCKRGLIRIGGVGRRRTRENIE